MGSNGTVVSRGTDIATAISRNFKLVSEMEAAKQPSILKDAESDKERTSSNGIPEGKLIVTEEIQQGHVTWKAMKLFFASAAGDHPIMFFLAFLFGLLLCDLGIMSQTYFLGYWGSQYTERDPAEINPFLYVVCFFIRSEATYPISSQLSWRLLPDSVRSYICIHVLQSTVSPRGRSSICHNPQATSQCDTWHDL